MITDTSFFGSAERTTLSGANKTLNRSSPRVQAINCTSVGCNVILPSSTGLKPGGPYYYIHNVGTNSVIIGTGTPITLAVNEVCTILLRSSGVWFGYKKTVNTASTAYVNRSTSPDDFASTAATTYAEDCTSACNDATVVAQRFPMWINSCIARNSLRDPIRGADLIMLPSLQIKITNAFVQDTSHSHAGAMTDAMYKALFASHVLAYDSVGSYGTTSRSPYHVELDNFPGSSAWAFNGSSVAVTRKVWRKSVAYSGGTIELRLIAEFTDGTEGLWGTHFCFYAFCTEVNPAYVSGAADPLQNNATFTFNDPMVYAALFAGANPNVKFFHPQLLIAAVIPTTFHAPCGVGPIPAGDELWDACFVKTNGAPWSSGSVDDAWKNIVFAQPDAGMTGYTKARAMTIGGDVPTSEFYPFLCIENGAGYGGTYLKPTNAGWDEDSGDLTAASDLVVTACDVSQADAKLNPCEGHPDDLYGGVGGTHRCFKTSDHSEYCCLPPDENAYLTIVETCCQFTQHLGPYDGAACTPNSGTICTIWKYYTSPFTMPIEDYDFSILDSTLRTISWAAFGVLSTYDRRYFNLEDNYTEFTDELGTWTATNSSLTNNTVSGVAALTGISIWAPSGGFTCSHVRAQATVNFTTANVPHGIAVRWQSPAGYYCMAEPASNRIRIYYHNGATATVLAEQTGLTLTGAMSMEVIMVGGVITFLVGTTQITASHCTYKTGLYVAFVTSGATPGATFTEIIIEDKNADYTNPGSYVGNMGTIRAEIVASADEQVLTVYENAAICQKTIMGDCNGGVNLTCGNVDVDGNLICGCTRIAYTDCKYEDPHTTDDTTESAYVNILGGGNPEPEKCLPAAGGGCTVCPPPYISTKLILTPSCGSIPSANRWRFCAGAEWWWYTQLVFP